MCLRKPLLSAFVICALTACSGSGKKEVSVEPASVETLYEQAKTAMDDENYIKATKYFEEVERQHPYSQWSTRAQLMGAYSSYLDQRYDDAVISLERYIQLHPGAGDVDYVYYLKALCFYEQISDVRRDQEMTIQAVKALNALINLFPNSQYTRDAMLKRDLTFDHLAGKEMDVGRYYLNRGHVNASINRFRSVVVNFQTTSHVAEALHRLVEAYMTLGLRGEALHVAAVLGHNYPGSKWYERSYALLDDAQRQQIIDDRGIIERTFDSLLKPD
ncbi:MAG: outer membrane protein assembly factor BamD [Alphaproteobacteria bacterium]|nr:MAG: outer membrane protein assembly factor BamD [Alphaproteobacteria bacterium]